MWPAHILAYASLIATTVHSGIGQGCTELRKRCTINQFTAADDSLLEAGIQDVREAEINDAVSPV
jgi:hypothetical protein